MGKRVAIIGSRDFSDLALVRRYVAGLPSDVVIVSGGARGVDSAAEGEAKKRKLETAIYPADWSKGKGAGLARNIQIVEDADMVVAFWDGVSNGTLHSIREAVKRGKKVVIYGAEQRKGA